VTALIAAVALSTLVSAQTSQPATPAGCVQAARDFTVTRQRAAERITAEVVQQIQAEKVVLARRCAAQFDLATVPFTDLAALIELYGEASEPELASATLDRALGATAMPAAARADVLLQAIMSGLREPKSEARNARLEGWVAMLDALPGSVRDQQVMAHSRMNGYYRGDDIDAGIIRHSTWLIETAKAFEAAERTRHGSSIVRAYVNMAEAWAGQGRTEEALALLRTAARDWSDVTSSARSVDSVIARYELVGTTAAPIVAPRWLNMPEGTSSLPMTGAVTLLEFTAHWCGPCKESYPGLKRLLARFGDRGFRVVLATELYGYFQNERPLTEDEEYARDRDYFAHEGLRVPVAIAGQRQLPVRDASGNYVVTRNPNDQHYEVGGIPQIHIIGPDGRIHLIMVGYDDANEPQLAALIESLLPRSR